MDECKRKSNAKLVSADDGDPQAGHLRRLCRVAPLTREGEVELFRRIEESESQILRQVFCSSIGLAILLRLFGRVRRGQLTAAWVLEDGQDEELAEWKLARATRQLQRLGRRLEQLKGKQASSRARCRAELRILSRRVEETQDQIVATVVDLGLRKHHVEATIRDYKDQVRSKTAARAVDAAERRVEQARAQIVEANLRLVVSLSRKHINQGLDLPDLVQEGSLGLMKAIEKFEYRRAYKFSTYASWWVRQTVARALADKGRTIRLPVHANETLKKVTRANHWLTQQKGREPTHEELADVAELGTDVLRGVLRISQKTVSLEEPLGEDGGSELHEIIEDRGGEDPQAATVVNDLGERVRRALKTLSPREEQILCMRFGIGAAVPHTLEEVGKEYGLTRERIRQIEAGALRKLSHPTRCGRLRSLVG